MLGTAAGKVLAAALLVLALLCVAPRAARAGEGAALARLRSRGEPGFNLSAWSAQVRSDVGDALCGQPCRSDAGCSSSTTACNLCDYVFAFGKQKHRQLSDRRVCLPGHMLDSSYCGRTASPHATDVAAGIKHVLMIGDSVMESGYGPTASELLEAQGGVRVHRTTNAGPAPHGRRCLPYWLGDGEDADSWDAISFNHGLWDTNRFLPKAARERGQSLKPEAEQLAIYERALGHIADALHATRAGREGTLIFVLTTPTPEIPECCPDGFGDAARGATGGRRLQTVSCVHTIREYNAAAVRLLLRYRPPVHIVDAHGAVSERCCGSRECTFEACSLLAEKSGCPVHYETDEGRALLAGVVASAAAEALGLPRPRGVADREDGMEGSGDLGDVLRGRLGGRRSLTS